MWQPKPTSQSESIALAKEIIGERVTRLFELPKEQREEGTITLIMALAYALATTGTVFLKPTEDQPTQFGNRIGKYITEAMEAHREGSLSGEATAKAEDPWE